MPNDTSPAATEAKPEPELETSLIGYALFVRIAPGSEAMEQLHEVVAQLQGQGCPLRAPLVVAVAAAARQLLYGSYRLSEPNDRATVAFSSAEWLASYSRTDQGTQHAMANAHALWLSSMLDQYFPAE